ncbi:MAG: PIN domain-containing protein [Alphaproteobacteria bacterium]|nr:PIN domain-containing protein [Alphaproteobacteria bacterium]
MKYDAITLDANIFTQNGNYLEGGLLGQLEQFKQGSVQFVLSEIVYREVLKHITDGYNEAWAGLEKALKQNHKHKLLSDGSFEKMKAVTSAEKSPEEAAKNRLQSFIDRTGATIIKGDGAKICDLVRMYFDVSPPFENNEKKRKEFPDAIALLSLEKWADENNKKILAITGDKGWTGYADKSKSIDAQIDLGSAFEELQLHVEKAKVFVATFLSELVQGKHPDHLQTISESISNEVSSLEIEPEADSSLHYEVEYPELFFEDFEFMNLDEEYSFTIVQIGVNKIVFKIPVNIKAKAQAEFSFSAWDSIDKEYVPLGGETVENETEFEAAALITIEGAFAVTPPEIEVSCLELVDTIDTIDFGYVEPNHDDWYEE